MSKSYEAKKRWAERNYDKRIAKSRQSLLGGKWRGLTKRDYTGYCELCSVEVEKNLHYHHWDDAIPSMGLWMCAKCHRYAEGFDKAMTDSALLDTYAELRTSISKGYYQARLL